MCIRRPCKPVGIGRSSGRRRDHSCHLCREWPSVRAHDQGSYLRWAAVRLFDWLFGKGAGPAAERRVHCAQHGATGPAFVCRHARQGSGLGFYVANGPHPGDEGESPFKGCPNGWCGECEQKRRECGGWNDESEAFSGVTLVCVYCFEEIRRRNTTGNEAQ